LGTLALAGGEWSASHPSHFTPGDKTSSTRWIGGWVDPRASLDIMEKRKISCLRYTDEVWPVNVNNLWLFNNFSTTEFFSWGSLVISK
jgi:hypothetical protein